MKMRIRPDFMHLPHDIDANAGSSINQLPSRGNMRNDDCVDQDDPE
jgi:hypothetical protein